MIHWDSADFVQHVIDSSMDLNAFVDRMFEYEGPGDAAWCGGYARFDLALLGSMVRHFGVRRVIECAPCKGWSTTMIQKAMGDRAELHISFEAEDNMQAILRNVSRLLPLANWRFVHGDFRQTAPQYTPHIEAADLIFIDADHTAEFAEWYLYDFRLPSLMRPGALLTIHDIYPIGKEWDGFTESPVVMEWAEQKPAGYEFLHPARFKKGLDLPENLIDSPSASLWVYRYE